MIDSIRRTTLKLLTVLCMISLGACASMYHGYGYEEELSYPNGARIELRGNASDRQNFAMLRAAELTLERGHTHFVVMDLEDGIMGNQAAAQQRTYLTIAMYTNPSMQVRNALEADYIITSLSEKLDLET